MAQIIFTIPDDKIAEFKAGFLKIRPNPEPDTYNDNQWIKEWGKRQYIETYRRGKQALAQEAASVEDNLVT